MILMALAGLPKTRTETLTVMRTASTPALSVVRGTTMVAMTVNTDMVAALVDTVAMVKAAATLVAAVVATVVAAMV